MAGAGPLPDLSLPHTVLSGVDKTISQNGVIQTSSDNLTIYSPAVKMRLLGGPLPHDELLGPYRNLRSRQLWAVEALTADIWRPLASLTSNLTSLGTNSTGAFVVRTTQIAAGSYSGILSVAYETTPQGVLKWVLEFSPSTQAHYRLTYTWWNISSDVDLSLSSKHFGVAYGPLNYTFYWNDISTYNTTATLIPGRFVLAVDLGVVASGSKVSVDPSIVYYNPVSSTNTYLWYGFQRHVIYDPTSGYNYVFFDQNSGPAFSSSSDGINWSSPQSMPAGWPGVSLDSYAPVVLNIGRKVIAAAGLENYLGAVSGNVYTHVYYAVGNLTGPKIAWGPVTALDNVAATVSCSSSTCYAIAATTFVNIALSSDGNLAWAYDALTETPTGCTSTLFVHYKTYLLSIDSLPGCPSSTYEDALIPILLPDDPSGGLRVVYLTSNLNPPCMCRYPLKSRSIDSNGNLGPIETIDPGTGSGAASYFFSAVADNEYGTHLIYYSPNNITYAYRPALGSAWKYSPDIFSGYGVDPTITLDQSTDDVYSLASYRGTAIAMKVKHRVGAWSDGSIVLPVTGQSQGAQSLSSNLVSASATNSSRISFIWSQAGGEPWSVVFASVPIQTVWSPYSSPSDPWDGNGLAPYGQYFANLGESVSPSTGMLTIKQTDLSVPGRGLDLSITRVYSEPYSFLGNNPYNYENYPWAPIGDGWQLNFPWMSNTSSPAYIHLLDGEGYRIPSSFWNGGSPSTFENHQGENFRLIRNGTGVFLYDKLGVAYDFDPGHLNRLTMILDPLGNNITFTYNASNMISCVTDTVTRAYQFSYLGAFLQSISQINGTCASPGSSIRSILYSQNSGQSLTRVTDPAGRFTTYSYGTNPWLLARITYPTQWYDAYNYSGRVLGTQATSFRVSLLQVNATQTSTIREFVYAYGQGAGDQITNSTIREYDGTQPVGFTRYAFSFAGMTRNTTDSNNAFIGGLQQRFGVHGEVPREVVLVSPTQGYANYYRYDLWGNQIYGRRMINPSANWYHESFNAYYNDGLPPAFNAFQETFSQNQGTATDNPWSVMKGYWMVQNGLYNGTETAGDQADMIAGADIGKADISLQARVYVNKQLNNTGGGYFNRIGIFAHYNSSSSKTYKWGLALGWTGTSRYLGLVDDWTPWVMQTPCNFSTGAWYTFNMTVHGYAVTGWTSGAGLTCSINATFPSSSPAASYTGFGLYAGGYSALFANVTVTTISPFITTTGFSNTFINNGAPNSYIHSALAGVAELQNGTGSSPTETYYSYSSSGRLYQTKQLYNSPSAQWLTTTRTYDNYGNLKSLTDARGNQTSYGYSATYQSAYLTSQIQTVKPGGLQTTRNYTYNFAMGTMLSSQDPNGHTTTYSYDVLGRTTTVAYIPSTANILTNPSFETGDFTGWTQTGLIIRSDDHHSGQFSAAPSYNSSTQIYSAFTLQQNFPAISGGAVASLQFWYRYADLTGADSAQVLYSDGAYTQTTLPFVNSWTLESPSFTITKQVVGIRIVRSAGSRTNIYLDDFVLITNSGFITYTYNDSSNYVNITNENGWLTQQVYDGLGRPSSTERFSGATLYSTATETYNWMDKIIVQTDARGNATRYQYDLLGRTIMVTKRDGNFTQQFYNDTASWMRFADEYGKYRCNTYDRQGRLLSVVENATSNCQIGIVTNYYYDEVGNLRRVASSSSPPQTTTYSYDNLNRLSGTAYPDGTSESYGYDNNGNLVSKTDRKGVQTVYAYDSLNRVTAITYPGTTTTPDLYAYDLNSNLLQLQSQNATIAYTYDARNRVLSETYTVITGFNLTSSPASLNLWVGGSSGSSTITLTSINGYAGNVGLSYNAPSGITLSFNPNTVPLTTGGSAPSTATVSVASTVPAGTYAVTVTGSSGSPGMLTRSVTITVNVMAFTLFVNPAAVGEYCTPSACPLSLTGASNLTITSLGGFSGTVSLSYNAPNPDGGSLVTGQPSAYLTAGGSVIVPLGATPPSTVGDYLWTIIGQSGTHTTSATLDVYFHRCTRNCPSLPATGTSPTSAPTSSTSTSSPSSPSSSPSISYTITYTYNGELMNTTSYPDGLVVKYTYDLLGRVTTVSNSGTTSNYATFTYNRNDQPTTITFGNGLVGSYTYDKLSRPLQITLANSGTLLLSLSYNYYKTGTVYSVTGTVSSAKVNEQYSYDVLQRLAYSFVQSGGTNTTLYYSYDSLGNRLSQTLNSVPTNYVYNPANNELGSSSTPTASISYAYDPNGNLKARTINSSPAISYAWDPSNRLVKVTAGSTLQGAYAYDGMGRRVESVEAATTLYAYAGTESLYETVPGVSNNDTIYAGGFRIARVSGTTTKYFHTDALGSTRLVTSSTKTILFSDSYQPYGQDNLSSGSETYKFTGKPVSQTTGLYYEYQRWYDPSIGRFISRDPLPGHRSNPQTLNPYVYVLDSPTGVTDPSGMDGGFLGLFDQYVARPYLSWFNSNIEVPVLTFECGCNRAVVEEAVNQNAGLENSLFDVGVVSGVVISSAAIVTPYVLGTAASTASTGLGVCEEDPEACDPAPTPPTAPGVCECPGIGEGGGSGGVLPNQIGSQGVKATVNSLGKDFIGTEAPVYSENYGFGRIDIASTNKLVEVKNAQNLYFTNENELQLLKYVDAVGAPNLQYDIYANYVSPRFIAGLQGLDVDFRIFPYIPLP